MFDGSTDSDAQEYYRVLNSLTSEFPDFRIVEKSQSKLMRVIDLLFKVITFGRMSKFMTSYTTTIGYTVYTHSTWENDQYLSRATTLRHEAVHMRQRKRWGFLLFAFAYLFFPFPVIFAACRRKFEQEGYEETLRCYAEYYGVHVLWSPALRQVMVRHFLTASYFWMWPFRKSVEDWYDGFVDSLEKQNGKAG